MNNVSVCVFQIMSRAPQVFVYIPFTQRINWTHNEKIVTDCFLKVISRTTQWISTELLNVSLRCKLLRTLNFSVYQSILFSTSHEAEIKVSRFSSKWLLAQNRIWIAAGASELCLLQSIQTCPVADPAFYWKVIGVLSRGKGNRSVKLTTHILLVLSLR
jgi:hypothetical protein